MRVAIITESFPPDVNGVAHCVLRVAELLTSYGHHPLVIAPRPPGARSEDIARKEGTSFSFPVVRVPAAPLPGYPSFRLGLPSRRVRAALIRHRAEVVHLASPVFLGAHGGVVAGLLGQGIDNVWLWGRGVDTRRFDPAKRSQELRSSLAPGGELIAGYVGRLATEKRVELLAGLTALEGVRLVIVGAGPAEAMALAELGAGYLATGHEPVLVIPGERNSDGQTAQGRVITLLAPRVPFTGGYRVLWRRRRLARLLARLRPDVLEVSDRTTLRWTGRWARERGVPAVMVSHESVTALLEGALFRPAPFRLTPLGRAVADWLNRRTARAYQQVICTTGWAAAEFERIGAAVDRTVAALRAAGAQVLTMRLPDPGRMFGLPGVLARPLARWMRAR